MRTVYNETILVANLVCHSVHPYGVASTGIVLPRRKDMVQLWEIFLRSSYLEVFGIFHKPSITTKILRGTLPIELALGICMHSARYENLLSPSQNILLILGLRFSTTEVAKHGSATAAASYYADAAASLVMGWLPSPTIDSVIGLLLLALHEFSMDKGGLAWFHLGFAIRGLLSLDFGREIITNEPQLGLQASPQWKTQECRRRCFWSCFIVERLLSSGSHNPAASITQRSHARHHLIDLSGVNIQLPSSEKDFMFFRPVSTFHSVYTKTESDFCHRS